MGLRIGLGYDIHRVAKGRKLRLGGVSFPRAGFGLEGHSDADVILHALCDALLGAAGLPDIGVLFPNTARKNFRRDSLEFLAAVASRLRQHGFVPINADCTLLAEIPKIAPRVPLMRRRIARVLGLKPECIGIKATTQEGLGFVGRGEGLAAMAVALLQESPYPPKSPARRRH